MHESAEPLLPESVRRSTAAHARQSLAGRISASVARQMSYPDVVEDPRSGSVLGTTINTLSNVVGAGVLSLALVFYKTSVVGAIVLMLYTSLLAAASAYIVIIAAQHTQRFSYTELMAFSLFPPRTFEEFCASKPKALPANSLHLEMGTMEMEKMRSEHKDNEVARRKRRRIVTILVELMIFLNNYGALIIYARVIADSIPPVVFSFLHGSGFFITRTFWLLVSGIVFFLLTCVRNMNELKWSSLLGFLTIFYVIVVIAVRYATTRLDPPYPNISPEEHGETNWYQFAPGVFSAMSTYCVVFGFHYNIPYFYRELKDRRPTNMFKTILISFPIIVTCYIISGLFGYLIFGNLVANPEVGGDIVRNFPEDDTIVNVARLGLFIHFACVYPILSVCARRGLHRILMHALTWCSQTSPTEEKQVCSSACSEERETEYLEECGTLDSAEGERDVGSPESTTRLAIVVEALLLVSTTVLIAAFIPGINLMINILGILFGIFIVLTGPGIVAWSLFSQMPLLNPNMQSAQTYRRGRLFKCIAALLIFTGIFFTLAGLVSIIKEHT